MAFEKVARLGEDAPRPIWAQIFSVTRKNWENDVLVTFPHLSPQGGKHHTP